MQRFVLLISCFLSGMVFINAQANKGVCGTTHEFQTYNTEQYITNLKAAKEMRAASRNATTYLPIQYHIITRDNGTDGVLLKDVLAQHCQLNEDFVDLELQFYLDEAPTVIANNAIFNNPGSSGTESMMRNLRNREAINIWIVNSAGSGALGQTLGFYTPLQDWVVIRSDQITEAGKTLAHEVGHFLSLRHTHFGWCNAPYDEAEHGNPVQENSPGAVQGQAGGGTVATELVDGSNCETAGDMICDTPPDYNFSFTSNGSCVYTRETMDPNGDLVDPDESLIMSQYQDRCVSRFSEMQGLVMQADVASPSRNFLRINPFTPLAAEITDTPVLLSPVESIVTNSFNRVELRWNAVAGADSYLVELDRSASFNIDQLNFLATSNTFLLEDILDADRNYRWRVTPLNASYTCAASSETGRFRTGISTSVASIETVDDWSIQPNPIRETEAITIKVNSKKAFTADIKIYTMTGQIIKQQSALSFALGTSTIQMPIEELTKGVYFITLDNEEGILNKKLIIQ